MTELYSVRDVAKLFALQESRLRYWMQTGFVGPTVRKGGRFYYTFRDLCAVKAAKGGAVEFRGGAGVCDGEGPCHGCRQPWVVLPAVMQMRGEPFEPFERCAVTGCPVSG